MEKRKVISQVISHICRGLYGLRLFVAQKQEMTILCSKKQPDRHGALWSHSRRAVFVRLEGIADIHFCM